MSTPVLFVTGGGGLLGRRVVRAARDDGWTVVAPGSAELDVRDALGVERAVRSAGPTAIAHLAYRKDRSDVIVDGTASIAAAAARLGIRLVHLSTDAVFAGRDDPYVENDLADPVTDYGRWKVDAERSVATQVPDAVIVRTSLLYATDELAPCQTAVVDVLTGASDLRFFTDELRCFTHVDDVAAAVVTLASTDSVTGPLHVAASRHLDRATFARTVAAWLGHDPARIPTSTIAASGLDRPGAVILDSGRAHALGLACRDVDQAFTGPPPGA